MSQEKVDRYKEEKANRKKIMKREKIKKAIGSVVGTILCVVIVGWIGYSGYNFYQSQKAENPTSTEIDLSAVNDYLGSLSETGDAE
ncbi:hypothetical protein [Roseburia sp. 499]|uniref:hypothetical protein n=1 Tax=Roseburia sp. 499 TaxID=1261634 RepID=UPI000951F50B|nr:hypothetical protein [Roseburia sp. 499]WVK70552.1 hypothetical protein BIV20_03210 [Roseburia sp. 499]